MMATANGWRRLKTYTFECRCEGHLKIEAYDLKDTYEHMRRCYSCGEYFDKLVNVTLVKE